MKKKKPRRPYGEPRKPAPADRPAGRRGREQRVPVTPELLARIKQLARQQLLIRDIAACIGYSLNYFVELKTAHPEIAEAIKAGYSEGLEEVTQALLANVKKGNIAAQIFFLKAKGGWRDDGRESIGDDDSSAIAQRIQTALERVTDRKPDSGEGGAG